MGEVNEDSTGPLEDLDGVDVTPAVRGGGTRSCVATVLFTTESFASSPEQCLFFGFEDG